MWIAFRLVLALLGFVLRLLHRGRSPRHDGTFRGVPYAEHISTQKKRITGFRIAMPRRSPTWLRLHAESATDRLCKAIGIATETQTGDEAFDRRVYVTCDHPAVARVLAEEAPLRAAILTAFDAGFRAIRFDGQAVWIERTASAPPGEADKAILHALHQASERLEEPLPSFFADPFAWKALVVEGVIWSLVGYAIGAGVERFAHAEDFHLHARELVLLGLAVAAVAFLALVGVIAVWMAGSSRGHRIIVESAILLVVALPITAIQVVGDTNRSLDTGAPIAMSRAIERCETRVHRRRRGRSYSYHLWLIDEVTDRPRLPGSIEVTRELCRAVDDGARRVELEIGPGRWGLPHYRTIAIDGVRWTAP